MTTLFISHSSKDRAWALQVHEALRGRGYDKLFLDSHPDDGIPVGDKWEQTLWQQLKQSGGVVVLCTAHWLASPWCVAEAMIARERGKPVFMLATTDVVDGRQVKGQHDIGPTLRIPDFLKDTQFISLADVTADEAYRRLWLRLESLKRDIFPLPEQPYPGLKTFEEKDAAVFFGRAAEVAEVTDVLKRRLGNNAKGFILVLGASGCGKSSLVRAGVLPTLKPTSGHDGSNGQWVIPPPIMAGKGLEELVRSLADAFDKAGKAETPSSVRQRLIPVRAVTGEAECDVRALRELASDLLFARRCSQDGYILLILDQLEEVFGTPKGSEARMMLRLLLEGSADASSSVVILATMRSDFLNSFQLFEGAADRYEKITLDPMPRSRFGEVIKGPADRFGLDLDPGLSERMAEETAYNDALPLLAFTLEKLYEKCKAQGRLTCGAYDELGGVSAAIKHAADAILEETGYLGMPADDPRVRDLRRAFYSLARVREEGQFTRRTAYWSQMPASCEAILKRFEGRRLLVSGAEKEKENVERTLSVAHEALFRVWDTLNGWLSQSRKALVLKSQIEDAAAEWKAENRTASHAWAEERVLDAVRQIEESGVTLADVKDRATVDAFLGPTDPKELETLPSLDAAKDAMVGSGRYGDAWRLPLSHEARASAGVRLALLGDRRKGVRLRNDGLPDIDWRRIEGGDVTIEIRANPENPDSAVIKRLTRSVNPFWMARYPVTIAQFQVFLGESNPPTDYQPPKYRARYDNHPVDNVNWYDATAFCHWLSGRLGFEVRLPTECEWQRAATGGDPARTYPWGSEQEPWRTNTFENGLGHSTAVGMYPAGASPADILDMAGTVWEWCLDPFEAPDSIQGSWLGHLLLKRPVQEDRRVLRGGSWSAPQRAARSTARIGGYPHYRFDDFGFRVVCSSPQSVTDH